jgi:hypothetical protein
MGLELFSPDEERSAVVTAIRAPRASTQRSRLALRDRFGITIANGQGELKGKIFRIGHIGWFDVFDITTALAAVELALVDAGAEIERGVARDARARRLGRALARLSRRPRPRDDRRSRDPAAARPRLRRRRRRRLRSRRDDRRYDAIVIRSATKLTAD